MKIETLPLSPEQPPAQPPAAPPATPLVASLVASLVAPARPASRRRRAGAIGLALLVLAAGAYVANAALSPQGAVPARPAAARAELEPVRELSRRDVAVIEARALALTLPLSGSLTPLAQATVKSKVSGVVLHTGVQEGMNVTAGQVIARLDDAEARARLAQQQALLADANARLALARKNQANSAALLKQNYIAQNAYDTTANAVDLAQAAVDAARAQVELARIALLDTAIRAPLSGVVSRRHAQAGEKLAPDSPVFSIVDLKQLTLDAQVPASDIPRIKVGQAVRFRVDGFGQREFTGTVVRINPATEAGSRAMLVYIGVANPDGALRAGMFAKGEVTTEKSAPRPLLPLTAVRHDKDTGQDTVYRLDGGAVVAQPVRLGLRNEDEGLVEALDGVQAGATVLAVPLDDIKPGVRVKLPEAAAPSPVPAVPAAPAAAAVVKG